MSATGIPASIVIGAEIAALKSEMIEEKWELRKVIEEQKKEFQELKELFLSSTDSGRLQSFEELMRQQLQEQYARLSEQLSGIALSLNSRSQPIESANISSNALSSNSSSSSSSASAIPVLSSVTPPLSNILSLSEVSQSESTEQKDWARQRVLSSWGGRMHPIASALALEGENIHKL